MIRYRGSTSREVTLRVRLNLFSEMIKDAIYFKEKAESLPEDSSHEFERWRYLRASIIYSFSVIESYINEFIEKSLENKKRSLSTEDEEFFKNSLEFLKRHFEKRKIEEKLKLGVKLVTGKEIDTSSLEYKDFIELRHIRNMLMHPKTEVETYKLHKTYVTIKSANNAINTAKGIIKKIHELDGAPPPPFVELTHSTG